MTDKRRNAMTDIMVTYVAGVKTKWINHIPVDCLNTVKTRAVLEPSGMVKVLGDFPVPTYYLDLSKILEVEELK